MEQEKKGDLLALIDDYRLIRKDDHMFHIQKSIEDVQSTCQKVELSRNIKVLLRDLPLTSKKRHRLLDYTNSSYPCGSEFSNVAQTYRL